MTDVLVFGKQFEGGRREPEKQPSRPEFGLIRAAGHISDCLISCLTTTATIPFTSAFAASFLSFPYLSLALCAPGLVVLVCSLFNARNPPQTYSFLPALDDH